MLIVTAGVKTNAFFQVEFCKKLFSRAAVLVFICLFSLYFFLEIFRYVFTMYISCLKNDCFFFHKTSHYFDFNNDAVLKTPLTEETLFSLIMLIFWPKILIHPEEIP